MRVLLILLLFTSAAHAQTGDWLVKLDGPYTQFNWPAIVKCAADKNHKWWAYCKTWVDAREEGKIGK
jgi:hypothetical protein